MSGNSSNIETKMSRLFFLLLTVVVISCSPANKFSTLLGENEIFVTRKYIGEFMDFRHTGPDSYDGPNLIWIKTSMEKSYGKISAYSKKCEFSVGDRLYIKRAYYTPGGVSGYWVYQIENDSSVYYRASDFQYDKKVLVQSWFN